jgi:hypothetical protein
MSTLGQDPKACIDYRRTCITRKALTLPSCFWIHEILERARFTGCAEEPRPLRSTPRLGSREWLEIRKAEVLP